MRTPFLLKMRTGMTELGIDTRDMARKMIHRAPHSELHSSCIWSWSCNELDFGNTRWQCTNKLSFTHAGRARLSSNRLEVH